MKLNLMALMLFLGLLTFTACGGGGGADSPVTNDPPNDGSPDIVAPAPGNSGLITAGSITANSLVLNWNAANDVRSAQLNLVYAVYQSSSNNISTVTDCENNGTEIQEFTTGSLTKTVSSLTSGTSYYFNVVVRDSSGNKAAYTMKQQTTTTVADITVPVPGNSGLITAGSITQNSIVLNWTAGSDNVTSALDLQFAVYQSSSSTLATVADWESATMIQGYTANLTTKNVTGLSDLTTYYFNVIVKDSAENKAVYTTKQVATTAKPDIISPMPGNGGVITASSITDNSLILNWNTGSDNITASSDLQYAVYQSTSSSLVTVSDWESTTMIQDYTSNLLSKNVTGLSESTTYYFNVIVRDSAGNKEIYNSKSQITEKKLSHNADLQNITISVGLLSPEFNKDVLDYTARVNNSINSVKIAPTSTDSNSVIKVDGNTVVSGSLSGDITLKPYDVYSHGYPDTPITISVIAEDGVTIKNYKVAVKKGYVPAKPSFKPIGANLTSLIISWNAVTTSTNYSPIEPPTYKLFRSASSSGVFEQIGCFNNKTEFLDTGLIQNTTYYYKLIASGDFGDSIESDVLSGTTLTSVTPPTIIIGAAVNTGSKYQISSDWSYNFNAGGACQKILANFAAVITHSGSWTYGGDGTFNVDVTGNYNNYNGTIHYTDRYIEKYDNGFTLDSGTKLLLFCAKKTSGGTDTVVGVYEYSSDIQTSNYNSNNGMTYSHRNTMYKKITYNEDNTLLTYTRTVIDGGSPVETNTSTYWAASDPQYLVSYNGNYYLYNSNSGYYPSF